MRCERADEIVEHEITANNDINVGFAQRDDSLFVTVRFSYKAQPPALAIDATLNLHYALSEERTADEAEAFAQVNGVFNAWPYWREIVQSTAARMGIMVPPIPLLKI